MQKILRNAARCRRCGDTVESKHRHDYVSCSCGAIAVDGGLEYCRRTAKSWDDLEDLSEFHTPAHELVKQVKNKGGKNGRRKND